MHTLKKIANFTGNSIPNMANIVNARQVPHAESLASLANGCRTSFDNAPLPDAVRENCIEGIATLKKHDFDGVVVHGDYDVVIYTAMACFKEGLRVFMRQTSGALREILPIG